MDLHNTNLLALLVQVVHGLLSSLSTGTHDDNNALSVLGTDVVVEMVLTTRNRGNGVHGVLNVLRDSVIEGLGSLIGLHPHVSSLNHTSVGRMSGAETTVLVIKSLLHREDLLESIFGKEFDGRDLGSRKWRGGNTL